jgi:homoserine O-acetyltransferase
MLDPERVRILGMDWLDHPTGISTHDQADALARVLDDLQIDSIDVLIGASYGAMVGLAFAQRHGHRLGRLVAIAGADRARPAAQALRQIQRAFLDLGDELGQPERGVAWARALALTSYRPAALFDQRFTGESSGSAADSLRAYLAHQGRRYGRDVSSARYRCLSNSIDEHQVVPALIRCPVDLIGVDSDTLVPLSQLEILQSRLAGPSRLHIIRSVYGHDAFLKENRKISDLFQVILEHEVEHG